MPRQDIPENRLPKTTNSKTNVNTEPKNENANNPTKYPPNLMSQSTPIATTTTEQSINTGSNSRSLVDVIPTKVCRVRFHVNGDRFFAGLNYVVNFDRIRTLDILCTDLSRLLVNLTSLPSGVRRIFRADNGHKIETIQQLENSHSFVCSSTDHFVRIKYNKIVGKVEVRKQNQRDSASTRSINKPPPSSGYSSLVAETPATAESQHISKKRSIANSNNFLPTTLSVKANSPAPLMSRSAVPTESINFSSKTVALLRGACRGQPTYRPTRPVFRFLINQRVAQNYDQLLNEISKSVRLNSGAVYQVRSLISGKKICSLADFNGDESIYLVYGRSEKCSSLDYMLDDDERRKIEAITSSHARMQFANSNKSINSVDTGTLMAKSSVADKEDKIDQSLQHSVIPDEVYQFSSDCDGIKTDIFPLKLIDSDNSVNKLWDKDKYEKIKLNTDKKENFDFEKIICEDYKPPLYGKTVYVNVRSSPEPNPEKDMSSKSTFEIPEIPEYKTAALKTKHLNMLHSTDQDRNSSSKSNDQSFGSLWEFKPIQKKTYNTQKSKNSNMIRANTPKSASFITSHDYFGLGSAENNNKIVFNINDSSRVVNANEKLKTPSTSSDSASSCSSYSSSNSSLERKISNEIMDSQATKLEGSLPSSSTKSTSMSGSSRESQPKSSTLKSSSRLFLKFKPNIEVGRLFAVRDQLGQGKFGKVFKCIHRASRKSYALKVVNKVQMKTILPETPTKEGNILKGLNHPNIIRLYQEFEFKHESYLILELFKHGDLFDALTLANKYTEPEASMMIHDLMQAVAYLHDRSIIHRDIKLENLMVTSVTTVDPITSRQSSRLLVKLADFGLAVQIQPGTLLFTICGTPTYVAPEILLEQGYTFPVDIWACGVIAYILMSGFPPFADEDHDQDALFEQIIEGNFDFSHKCWNLITLSAKLFIRALLNVKSRERLTARGVLAHEWIRRYNLH